MVVTRSSFDDTIIRVPTGTSLELVTFSLDGTLVLVCAFHATPCSALVARTSIVECRSKKCVFLKGDNAKGDARDEV